MKKKEFKISINAPRNVVWHVLWNDATYRQWTSVFHEGSYAASDWQEGSEIKFLGPDGSGMYSIIEKKEEPSVMAFKHLGEVKEGKKQPEGDWSGSMEVYTLKENGNNTDLTVEIDITEEFAEYFEKTFPKALQKVKEIAESGDIKKITIDTSVNAPVEKVWKLWTTPDDITKWSNASDDWHTPRAEHDLKVGGRFNFRMEARDGSQGFDFGGVYDVVKPNQQLDYTIGDGRKVNISFSSEDGRTKIVETFEAEGMYPIEMQRGGWQAILNSFKKYAENN